MSAADRERIVLLECRLEQLRSALDEARAEADRARSRVAEAAAREAEHARQLSFVHEELADARTEVAELHRRLDQSQALRAEVEGHLFEATSRSDLDELIRLRREVAQERQRATASEQTLTRLRARVEELLSSREIVLARLVEWQGLVREDEPEAADLAEFIAELRGEILELERRNVLAESREAALRERLALFGIDPDADAAEAALAAAQLAEMKVAAARYASAERLAALEAAATQEAIIVEERSLTPGGPRVAAEAGSVSEPSAAAEPSSAAEPPPGIDGGALPPAVGAGREAAKSADAHDRSAPEAPALPPVVDPPAPAAVENEPAATGASSPAHGTTPQPIHADPAAAELVAAKTPAARVALLLRLAKTGDPAVAGVLGAWTDTAEPSVRAAAYEGLGRLLDRDPVALEPYLRIGLADADARVRRRVVLAAATARRLALRPLLAPLREDPDPQVRRVVREVLRQAPPTAEADPQAEAPRRPDDARPDGDSVRFRAASGGAP